ncbi:MAG: Asp-tRNA(Asn)/Glu-tRNA(Gln) amidotransferase subunit GatC [Burkholderiaceae bacterium]|nr:Asp-tRNA(Asn)/Glu-tRNA(Gln) amidotransferase subunit GatC [Burkholderiaceae bacterium]MCD8517813.1 Asp-tRNA(Asn)/Glu-tRNA(Gln) amidotransferase subunit GatC [Burkholderiaceae bacterium]MCD8537229.1 Asp-tRNA(Asn)/Glu-tRNA(Gln) amidotransferase subunit GatC [Burkholderiaceae bacterium]MCD8564645.1 Asp-tRNA(Asn)/Glu-tRNA(Gln) amidotransferase subunit GatC [Burkholderiaceae bacterium]
MALTESDVTRIAQLARLHLKEAELPTLGAELNQIMALIEQLQSIDTSNIEPLAHPLSVIGEVGLRLRDDIALPANDEATRDHFMQNAPAREGGVFLVPRVIE